MYLVIQDDFCNGISIICDKKPSVFAFVFFVLMFLMISPIITPPFLVTKTAHFNER